MKKIIYRRWDDTQEPFSLKRKDILDKFMENIMKGMTPNTSMMQMLWDGFELAGMNFRVMGLEEMVQELQRQVDDLFAKYHLENAFDQPISDFKNLLSQEQFARHEKGLSPAPSYEQLPAGLLEKLNQLVEVVFVVRNDTAYATPLKRGIGDDTYYEVADGINDGDMIVTGPYRVLSKDLQNEMFVKDDKKGKSQK